MTVGGPQRRLAEPGRRHIVLTVTTFSRRDAVNTVSEQGAIKTITTHCIGGVFVEPHNQQAMDIIRPTDGRVSARVRLADEEDTRRASRRFWKPGPYSSRKEAHS
jgi:hypothetical protein